MHPQDRWQSSTTHHSRVLRREGCLTSANVASATNFELGLVAMAMCDSATGVELKDRAGMLRRRTAKSSFVGKEAVTWMVNRHVRWAR